jgi:hypothetical protein
MRAQTERLRLEYRDSIARARELVSRSGSEAMRRKAEDGGWCASECLDHLNLTNEDYLRRMTAAVGAAEVRPPRREETLSWIGRYFVRSFEPPVKRRFTAAATLVPAGTPPRIELLASRFEQTHQHLIRLIEETDAIDRTQIKITLADSDWVRVTLFDAFCLLAAHDRRHLWQAERAARV